MTDERRWRFDVTVSDHEPLKQGIVAKRLYGSQHDYHRVVVLATTFTDAVDAAAGTAWCHGEVTGIYLRT